MTDITCISFPAHGICIMTSAQLNTVLQYVGRRYTEIRSGAIVLLYRYVDRRVLHLTADYYASHFGDIRDAGYLKVIPWPEPYQHRTMFSPTEVQAMMIAAWPEDL